MVALSPPNWFVRYATRLVFLLFAIITDTMITIKVNPPPCKPMLHPHLKVLIPLGIPTLMQHITTPLILQISMSKLRNILGLTIYEWVMVMKFLLGHRPNLYTRIFFPITQCFTCSRHHQKPYFYSKIHYRH